MTARRAAGPAVWAAPKGGWGEGNGVITNMGMQQLRPVPITPNAPLGSNMIANNGTALGFRTHPLWAEIPEDT